MLTRFRDYTLSSPTHHHAHVAVNPTGRVEVEILEESTNLEAEFEEVRFERKGNLTELVASHLEEGQQHTWQLPLANNDARDLEKLIDEASEELEILMRDL